MTTGTAGRGDDAADGVATVGDERVAGIVITLGVPAAVADPATVGDGGVKVKFFG